MLDAFRTGGDFHSRTALGMCVRWSVLCAHAVCVSFNTDCVTCSGIPTSPPKCRVARCCSRVMPRLAVWVTCTCVHVLVMMLLVVLWPCGDLAQARKGVPLLKDKYSIERRRAKV
jgi:hypothetical protein